MNLVCPKQFFRCRLGRKSSWAKMAMRGLGQISLLAETAQPDCGIITGVGTAHIELLRQRRKIIQAKFECLSTSR